MCAINPRFKKRIIFDFYTASPKGTEEDFINAVLEYSLQTEQTINKYGDIRVHVKESKEEAE